MQCYWHRRPIIRSNWMESECVGHPLARELGVACSRQSILFRWASHGRGSDPHREKMLARDRSPAPLLSLSQFSRPSKTSIAKRSILMISSLDQPLRRNASIVAARIFWRASAPDSRAKATCSSARRFSWAVAKRTTFSSNIAVVSRCLTSIVHQGTA